MKGNQKLKQNLSDNGPFDKKIYPEKILLTIIFYIVLMFIWIVFLIYIAYDMEGIIVSAGMPGVYLLYLFIEIHRIYKTQKIEFADEKIIIKGKIRKDPCAKLENDRNEVMKRDIYRVGYSQDLYGEEIYHYHYQRRKPSEVAIELKNGKTILFDAYGYTSKQKLYFLKAITEKGDVLVEGKLKEMMSRKRYKRL